MPDLINSIVEEEILKSEFKRFLSETHYHDFMNDSYIIKMILHAETSFRVSRIASDNASEILSIMARDRIKKIEDTIFEGFISKYKNGIDHIGLKLISDIRIPKGIVMAHPEIIYNIKKDIPLCMGIDITQE